MPKAIPIPIPFILVAATAIALFIFFGAWAVSADQGRLERTLSRGYAPEAGLLAEDPGSVTGRSGSGRGELPVGSARTAADTWWGKGLLAACPLH